MVAINMDLPPIPTAAEVSIVYRQQIQTEVDQQCRNAANVIAKRINQLNFPFDEYFNDLIVAHRIREWLESKGYRCHLRPTNDNDAMSEFSYILTVNLTAIQSSVLIPPITNEYAAPNITVGDPGTVTPLVNR